MKTKWEYKTEFRKREIHKLEWDNPIIDKLNQLGSEGWELISVAPRSGQLSSGNGNYGAAGLTTEEVWVFKRQVE